MVSKTNEAANLILKREPKAADQVESLSLATEEANGCCSSTTKDAISYTSPCKTVTSKVYSSY